MPQLIALSVATPLTIAFFNCELITRLIEKGFIVDVYCNTKLDTYVLGQITDLGATIRHLPVARKPSLLGDILAMFCFWEAFRVRRPEVSISLVPKTGLVAGIGALLSGVKTRLHIFQGEVWYGRSGPYRAIFRMLDTITAKVSSHCLCVSNSEREFLIANRVVGDSKLLILGAGSICGVNIPQALRPKKTNTSVGLLFVGRVARDKGIFDLLAAFQELLERGRNVALTIVGPLELSGELLSRFKVICAGFGGRVLVRSFETDLDEYYRDCDILCLPSYREGFGMVAIEASSYAKPVVGYDIVGLRDAVIHGETGLLCSPRDIDGLCDTLDQLVNEPQLRDLLGKAGRSYVEANFRRNLVVSRYADYISLLVDGRP